MRPGIAIPVVVVAALVAGLLAAIAPFSVIDGLADDAAAAVRIEVFGERDMSAAAVVVLALDERSVTSPPLDAVPRALMSPIWAALTEKALQHGATGLALDFILAFDASDLRVGDVQPLKGYDNTFLKLLRKEGQAGRLWIGRSKDLTPARRFSGVARSGGIAFVDVAADSDGVARSIRNGFTLSNGEIAPTLSGALLGVQSTAAVPVTPPAPLTALPAASVVDVLACDDEAALQRLFQGRAVLVGSGLPGEDRLRSPDRFMTKPAPEVAGAPCDFARPDIVGGAGGAPGVYLHAAAVDAVKSGWALAPASINAIGVLSAIAAALAAFMALQFKPLGAALAAFVIAAIGFAGAVWAQEAGVLFAAARPGLGALVGFGFGWAGRLFFLERRARSLRAGFGRYVAPELVDRLLAQDRLPELDGEQRHVAIMFADLSGFTALSELVDGKTLTATVNAYLGVIAAEVERSGGYVDKFIGDAVMAIWNAPADLANHERAAVAAAVAIRDAVTAAAARDEAQGSPSFSIKVGVNSGSAIVGNVGSANRLNYTAVGDTVNIAARLEGLPSVLRTPVVLGAACAAAAKDDFPMLEVASIQVKGRKEPVAVYAPLLEQDRPFMEAYGLVLGAYRERAFKAAAEGWRALAEQEWSGAALAAAMAEIAEDAGEERLGDDWAGQIVMKTK